MQRHSPVWNLLDAKRYFLIHGLIQASPYFVIMIEIIAGVVDYVQGTMRNSLQLAGRLLLYPWLTDEQTEIREGKD